MCAPRRLTTEFPGGSCKVGAQLANTYRREKGVETWPRVSRLVPWVVHSVLPPLAGRISRLDRPGCSGIRAARLHSGRNRFHTLGAFQDEENSHHQPWINPQVS